MLTWGGSGSRPLSSCIVLNHLRRFVHRLATQRPPRASPAINVSSPVGVTRERGKGSRAADRGRWDPTGRGRPWQRQRPGRASSSLGEGTSGFTRVRAPSPLSGEEWSGVPMPEACLRPEWRDDSDTRQEGEGEERARSDSHYTDPALCSFCGYASRLLTPTSQHAEARANRS